MRFTAIGALHDTFADPAFVNLFVSRMLKYGEEETCLFLIRKACERLAETRPHEFAEKYMSNIETLKTAIDVEKAKAKEIQPCAASVSVQENLNLSLLSQLREKLGGSTKRSALICDENSTEQDQELQAVVSPKPAQAIPVQQTIWKKPEAVAAVKPSETFAGFRKGFLQLAKLLYESKLTRSYSTCYFNVTKLF